ncbi:MAG: hypothetical protein AB8B79_12405 [Granulosicoccus sp.]
MGYSKNSLQMEMLQADGLKEPVLSKRMITARKELGPVVVRRKL